MTIDEAVDALEADTNCRCGLGDEWESFGPTIRTEIRAAWRQIVVAAVVRMRERCAAYADDDEIRNPRGSCPCQGLGQYIRLIPL